LSVPITLLKRLAPTSFEVGLYDRSTTKNVSCTLKAVFIDGSMADFATAQSSNGGPGAGFSHPGANVMTTFNGAEELAMFVECTIPPAQSGAFSHVQYYEMFYAII